MKSSTLLLLAQHSRRCRRKARRSSRQRAGARKTKRNDGINAGKQRDLSAGLPLDCIASRLPLHQRAQMMCVCKAWYFILRDWVAADLAEVRKGTCPWLLMARYCHETGWKLMAHGKAGSPSLQIFSIPLRQKNLRASNGSFEGLLMGCTCDLSFPEFNSGQLLDADRACPDFWSPRLASSGGLMCGLFSADPHHLKGVVVVFNCLTGSFKLLPPPLRSDLLFSQFNLYHPGSYPYPCPCSILMAIDDSDPTRYYIMLTRVKDICEHHFTRSQRHMEVFDSKTGSWKDASLPLERFRCDEVEDSLPSYVWDGDFFFIFENEQIFGRAYPYVGAYNAARDAWSLRLVPHTLYTGEALLHKFQGRLFVAITTADWHGFRVCEVKEASTEVAAVVEVARTPPEVSREIEFRLDRGSITTSAFWDLLAGGSCFCWSIAGRVHEVPAVVFDLASNSWSVLLEEEGLSGFYGALVYQPNLYARD